MIPMKCQYFSLMPSAAVVIEALRVNALILELNIRAQLFKANDVVS